MKYVCKYMKEVKVTNGQSNYRCEHINNPNNPCPVDVKRDEYSRGLCYKITEEK